MRIPSPPPNTSPELLAFFRSLLDILTDMSKSNVSRNSPVDALYLAAPNKKVYRVSVNTDGDIVAELAVDV